MTEPARGAEISRLSPPAQILPLKGQAASVSWFSTLGLGLPGLPVRWMLLGLTVPSLPSALPGRASTVTGCRLTEG